MQTPGSPEFSRDDSQQSVNPYASGSVAVPRSAAAEVRNQPIVRDYRIQMGWADRRRFLRAVLPLRLYAIVGICVGGTAVLSLFAALFEVRQAVRSPVAADALWAFRSLFIVGKGLLNLYICWLTWKFADVLAATAGGASSSMGEWSLLQLRMAQLLVTTIAISFASQGWEMFVDLYLLDYLRSGSH
jgi:hypothetical protein